MPLRRITIPEPIKVTSLGKPALDETGTEAPPYTFARAVESLLNGSRHFTGSRKAGRSANALELALCTAEPGTAVDVSEEDWALLKMAAEEATGWSQVLLRKAHSHLDAIVDAPVAVANGAAKTTETPAEA